MNDDYAVLAALAEELKIGFKSLAFVAYNYSKQPGHKDMLGVHLRRTGKIIENIHIDEGYLKITTESLKISLNDPKSVDQLKVVLKRVDTWVSSLKHKEIASDLFRHNIRKAFTRPEKIQWNWD